MLILDGILSEKKCWLIATPLLSLLQKKNKVKFLLSQKKSKYELDKKFNVYKDS